jgi:hypothetical protein
MFGIVFEVVRKKAKDNPEKPTSKSQGIPIRFTKLIAARSALILRTVKGQLVD